MTQQKKNLSLAPIEGSPRRRKHMGRSNKKDNGAKDGLLCQRFVLIGCLTRSHESANGKSHIKMGRFTNEKGFIRSRRGVTLNNKGDAKLKAHFSENTDGQSKQEGERSEGRTFVSKIYSDWLSDEKP
jgi:hypothetical protein